MQIDNNLDDSSRDLNGTERRKLILNIINNSTTPISGSTLGKETGVSRQIVVQDIALLRTQGYPILSTSKGYLLSNDNVASHTRTIKVCHNNDQVEDELTTIIDLGGSVIDVIVNHRTYGKVSAPLNIKSRRDITNFINNLDSSKSSLLSNITSGYHFHTVSADSEEILNEIENALKEKGFLADVLDYENV